MSYRLRIKIIFSLSSILEESADLDDVITAEDGDKKVSTALEQQKIGTMTGI
jgi:hypothetical protein